MNGVEPLRQGRRLKGRKSVAFRFNITQRDDLAITVCVNTRPCPGPMLQQFHMLAFFTRGSKHLQCPKLICQYYPSCRDVKQCDAVINKGSQYI